MSTISVAGHTLERDSGLSTAFNHGILSEQVAANRADLHHYRHAFIHGATHLLRALRTGILHPPRRRTEFSDGRIRRGPAGDRQREPLCGPQ